MYVFLSSWRLPAGRRVRTHSLTHSLLMQHATKISRTFAGFITIFMSHVRCCHKYYRRQQQPLNHSINSIQCVCYSYKASSSSSLPACVRACVRAPATRRHGMHACMHAVLRRRRRGRLSRSIESVTRSATSCCMHARLSTGEPLLLKPRRARFLGGSSRTEEEEEEDSGPLHACMHVDIDNKHTTLI